MTSPTAVDNAANSSSVELAITGMTCASCASRIEKKLNKIDGVTATVNYATEKAKVTFPDGGNPSKIWSLPSRTPVIPPRSQASQRAGHRRPGCGNPAGS